MSEHITPDEVFQAIAQRFDNPDTSTRGEISFFIGDTLGRSQVLEQIDAFLKSRNDLIGISVLPFFKEGRLDLEQDSVRALHEFARRKGINIATNLDWRGMMFQIAAQLSQGISPVLIYPLLDAYTNTNPSFLQSIDPAFGVITVGKFTEDIAKPITVQTRRSKASL